MTKKFPKRGLPPMHPGQLLREEILPAFDRPKTEIAKLLGVSRQTLYDILEEKQPVTPVMALRLGKLCGNGPDLWLNLQKRYDMQREFPLFGPLQTMGRYYNDVFGSYIDQIFAHNGSFPMLQADSSCGCQNRGDANEVVGSGRENEEPFNQAATPVPGLAEATNGFQPTERLLDLLSLDRADAIARVARGPRVNCRPAIGVILGHMRRAATLATSSDEVRGVIVLVGAHGASRLGIVIDHVKGGGAFSCAVGFSEPRVDDESVAVLCQQMAHVTELCLFSAALAEQPRIRIGCREVRVIRAFLAMKVALGVASATGCSTSRWRRVTTILGNKALHARPSLDQRTVDREVLAREQAADLRQVQDAGHELTGNIAVQQTIP